jgi:hypothetical protein
MGGDHRRISNGGERRPLALRDAPQAEREQRDQRERADLGERATAVIIGEMIGRRHEEQGGGERMRGPSPHPAKHRRARAGEGEAEGRDDRGARRHPERGKQSGRIEGQRRIIIENRRSKPVMRGGKPARIEHTLAKLIAELIDPNPVDPEAVVQLERAERRRQNQQDGESGDGQISRPRSPTRLGSPFPQRIASWQPKRRGA